MFKKRRLPIRKENLNILIRMKNASSSIGSVLDIAENHVLNIFKNDHPTHE